ncbi:hypothetical protein EJ05DRAFT_466794 [Pseudovirgaria hyperparasitica]|uniref:Zn(2)-C6 fungal-type domain-containing protein n=1 Tax=Pseudovirgaria hyperparasitica TaxID=470096 RepID=A0A6A6W4G8_9PEZI|nr:uncharacterized protein EJ05DRAFT_466794 [Pseudovirgaria hyperparasitica]KAF2756457.1 hypothetical protein EJ05DRAFT_466794 [Pseudovirgaria hyperparasitica]
MSQLNENSPLRTSPLGHKPMKRPRTACTRCKNRKQKCDSQWPTCSNCEKSGNACDKSLVGEPLPTAYTHALEERVAALEIELSRTHQNVGIEHPIAVNSIAGPRSDQHDASHIEDALRDVVDALHMGNFEAPAYVGSSSGLPLALNLGQMVQATVWNKAMPPPRDDDIQQGTPIVDKIYLSSHSQERTRIMVQDIQANSSAPPDDQLGTKLIHAYFQRLHIRYPFLDPGSIWTLHANRSRLSSTDVKMLSSSERFGIFKMYMVYAIGAMLLQLTERLSDSSPPESFYMTALQHISAAREPRCLQNVEAMLLLIIYHLRSASTQGLWYMSGLAMRTCVDLGMHRATSEISHSPEGIQRRRLLFWSTYSLERIISISLGRPCSISDRHIDLPLPSAHSQTATSPALLSSLSYPITLYELRRVESRIYNSIYRNDRSLCSLRPKIDRLYADLEEWRLSAHTRLCNDDLEYPMLHYHKALRLLLQPFLLLLPVGDPYYQTCLRAAGQICQAHKRLHQSFEYGHSFIAVQTVFVAGITMLYCLWTSSHKVWSVTLSNDIRACSSVLFVMGERADWVRKYRDAFEILVNATMQKVGGDAETEQSPDANFSSTMATGSQRSMGTAAAHVSIVAASEAFVQHGTGSDEALRMVMELANWIDHDDGVDAWMPGFEHLESLTGSFDVNEMF